MTEVGNLLTGNGQEKYTKVKCKLCEKKGESTYHHYLGTHLKKFHKIDIEEYLAVFGKNTPTGSNELWEEYLKRCPEERKGSKRFAGQINILGISLRASDGDVSDKFNRPNQYRYPEVGTARDAAKRVVRAFKYKRNLFIYGPAGTGKSAIIRALCHDLNIESSHYPMREGLDPELYLGKEAVVVDEATGQNITKFIEGKLLKDLKGRVGVDGVTRGVCILIDDIDRAPAEYHEILRHVLEDNAQNVFIPELGVTVNVHPDTRIIATANSAGRGDMTGYYSSVQEMDESVLDRFERVVEYHFMEKEEEKGILKNKFPELDKCDPNIFNKVMSVADQIRELISNREIFASFSHRRIVQWLQSVEELYYENGCETYKGILNEAAQDWIEWYDQATRDRVVDRVKDINLPKKD